MTSDEAVAQITTWMDKEHKRLGNMAVMDGELVIQLAGGVWKPLKAEDDRRYLIGYFQEWFVENEQQIADCVGPQRWLYITAHIPHRTALGILWDTYKTVHKITVG